MRRRRFSPQPRRLYVSCLLCIQKEMANASSAKTAALVLPPQSVPFRLPQQTAATCNASLARPWEIGSWTNTDLNPFDDVKLLKQEISTLQWCHQTPTMLHGAAGKTEAAPVVECSTCDYGYILTDAGRGPPQCRDAPVCNGQLPGKQCTLSALTPWLVGDCASCIQPVCDPYTGMASCNEL